MILHLELELFKIRIVTDSPPPPVGGNGISVHCANQLEIKGFSSTKSWKVVAGLPFNVNGLDPAPA